MLVDAQLLLSSEHAITAAADSTNIIDMGVAARDIGTGHPLYLVVLVHTALTDGGSNTGTAIALQGDSTTTISPDQTVTLPGSFAQAAAAGTVKIWALDPGIAPLQLRYVNIRYAPAGANLTGGKFTAFLTNNISRWQALADAVTVS